MRKNSTDKKNSRGNDFVKIPNPYSAYDIETGKWFYHEDVIKKVQSEFQASPPRKVIVIHGFIGSGKTSTLLRIADEPGMLGPNYIPIYINTGDSPALTSGAAFLFFYNAIKDSLSLWGYQIDKPNYSFSPGISLEELKYFFDIVGKKLAGHTILLIIDDFERIQQNTDAKTMEVFRELFKFLIYNTKIFRLILAGKGDIFKSVRETDMNYLEEVAFQIELGMFLERKKIEKLIVDPVKKYVKYDPEAIKEIVRITGRNLYCQQLLCHYLVEYLNEKRLGFCSGPEVQQAVYKAIIDKREDFDYFWNHLSYERKIIMAALADDSLIKKRGRYYFFEESPLLDSIFDENNLKQILEALAGDQHINPIKGRRFDSEPFTIPLYGEWVKRSHPLVQTVVENWEHIIEHISLSALEKFMHAIPMDRLPLEKEMTKKIKKLSRIWLTVKTQLSRGRVDKEKITNLVKVVCDILGFEVMEKPGNQRKYFTVNMGRLNLGAVENVMLFVPSREELSDHDITSIKDEILIKDKPANPSFILCLKKTDPLVQLAQKPFLGIVLVEEKDLKTCVLSPTPLQVFKKEVLIRQIRPSVVSPYKTEGPVRATFYGRQDEIGRILGKRARNFAVVGARKIGKTSLLLKILSELPSTTIPFYMDLEDLDTPGRQDYLSFLAALREKISEKYHQEVTFANDLSNFSTVIKRLGLTGKKPVFFLDEFDLLLKYDKENDYKLLTIFRALAQERYCQVIISGFRELYLARMGIHSPLYNFLEIITLDKLKEKDALALVSEPMDSIGIKYAKTEDKKRIIQHTSSHPNLIQFFCKGLVEGIQDNEDPKARRTIHRKDIDDLFESFDYENYVINDFYLFFTRDFDPLERLIILLLLEKYPQKNIFTSTEIIEVLKNIEIHLTLGQLAEYLTTLCLRYIFSPERGRAFRFALPIFPRILRKRYDIGNLIKEAKEDARKSISLYRSPGPG